MTKKKKLIIIVSVLFAVFSLMISQIESQEEKKPGVVFISPKADGLWTKTTKIEIKIENIAPEAIAAVELFLDGRLLKTFNRPPYRMNHYFGKEGQNHTLKVVVNGEGLVPLTSARIKSYHVDQSYDVEVQQVIVPVTVKDKKGNYIRGLKKDDFMVMTGEEPLEISYLSKRGVEKFNMVQVVDVSYSMRDKIHDVLQACQDFTEELMTEKDKGTFVFFNQRVYHHMGFTNDTEQLIERLNLRAPVMGGTALYDAISYSLNLLSKAPGWNIMIVFSDGYDNSSYIDSYSLMQKVKKTPVLIYGIDNRERAVRDILGQICEASGGIIFPLLDVKKTHKVFAKIREEIKAQYIIFFNPAEKGKDSGSGRFHPLTVRVKNHPDYELRALKGYYY